MLQVAVLPSAPAQTVDPSDSTVPIPLPATRTDLARLRVKIKSLAAEARIIRQEERHALRRPAADPARYAHYDALRSHRTQDVRSAARAALLAYAFLRGRAYNKTEPGAMSPWDASPVLRDAVLSNVLRFTPDPFAHRPGDARSDARKRAWREALCAWVRP